MSTAFTECERQQGGHQHPELIITEVLDENNQPVSDGEIGELVITTLGVEGMPLLRFKTGDLIQMHSSQCECGRNTPRVGPVLGRKQHMIKYKGTTIYPPAMHDVMSYFDEVKCHLIEISTNEVGTDEIVVKIGAVNPKEDLLKDISDHFRAKLRVTPKVVFVNIEELNKQIFVPTSRKPITLVDNRQKNIFKLILFHFS